MVKVLLTLKITWVVMSSKTWFFDIDGTLVRHLENDEILSGAEEQLLPQVEEFLDKLYRRGDYVILTTARWESQRPQTEKMLENFKLNYHHLIMGIGSGERILVNDIKPIDTEDNFREEVQPTAYAINVERNRGFDNMLLHEFWKKPFNSMERVWEMITT